MVRMQYYFMQTNIKHTLIKFFFSKTATEGTEFTSKTCNGVCQLQIPAEISQCALSVCSAQITRVTDTCLKVR